MSAQPEDHPFLTARHVDDLTDAVRALTHQLTLGASQSQQALDLQRRMLEVMRDIRDSTNALQEVITRQHTNGNGHHDHEGIVP
jgi:uncharacterized protein Yka (UPF0111/DUF47 family)